MVVRYIETYLDHDKYTFDIAFTKYQGHATEMATSARENGVDVVCAVGGDGTVNEIAKALIHGQTSLAIIPSGSGNGLARHLHIPMDIRGAIGVINTGSVFDIDYGTINELPFFCTCGVGFDAFISMRFAQAGKRGPLTYMENVLKTGLGYHPETYDISYEDKDGNRNDSLQAFLISCANASQYGNNAYIAPHASVRDGLMNVTIIEPFTVIDAPSIAVQLFTGTLDHNSRVKTFECKKLHIRRSLEGAVHYDGDPVNMGRDIVVELVPRGLKCLSLIDEGAKTGVDNFQGFIAEHFYQMYQKSEDMIQDNIRRTQRIRQVNKDIIRKLSKGNL